MRRETDAAMQPDSMTVELGDALERVVAARMTIAGQIVRSAENAEDRRPRTRAQRFAKVVESATGLVRYNLSRADMVSASIGIDPPGTITTTSTILVVIVPQTRFPLIRLPICSYRAGISRRKRRRKSHIARKA